MKRWRWLLAGIAVFIAGCAGSPGEADPARSTTTSSAAIAPRSVLGDQLRRARDEIDAQHAAQPGLTRGCFVPPFVMLEPTELSGFEADAPEVTPMYALGASVTTRLVDPNSSDRWVDFWQGLGCFGVLPGPSEAPTEMVDPRDIDVPGIETAKSLPRIYGWTIADGTKSVVLTWNSDAWASPNTGYHLIGNNVDEETLIRIAGSTVPVG
jgi:hypothetical protein